MPLETLRPFDCKLGFSWLQSHRLVQLEKFNPNIGRTTEVEDTNGCTKALSL